MGRASSRKRATLAEKQNEGTLEVSFSFDGRKYTRRHQFNAQELSTMKELLKEHGDLAADMSLWRLSTNMSGMFAENVLARAASDYIGRNYKGERKPRMFAGELEQASNGLTYADVLAAEKAQEQNG